MRKRTVAIVSMLGVAAILGTFAAFGAEEASCPPRFSYCGYSGPEQWKNLPIDRNECGGEVQSPVDITGWTAGPGSAISVRYGASPAMIANTGHDIEVKLGDKANFITIGSDRYFLSKFHFHAPSEHVINNQRYSAELHLVHEAEQGNRIAVIAVLLTVDDSSANPVLAEVFRSLPMKACDSGAVALELGKLLPASTINNYFTYDGSLTTPPCSQVVTFYIANGTGLTLTQEEYGKLEALGDNARPLQPINNRPIRLIEPAQ